MAESGNRDSEMDLFCDSSESGNENGGSRSASPVIPLQCHGDSHLESSSLMGHQERETAFQTPTRNGMTDVHDYTMDVEGHGHGSRIRTCDFLSSDRESTGEGEENHKKSSKKKKKRRRMGSPLNQQDSSGLYQDVQDIKDMLRTLCHKVDKNDLALREIQTTRASSTCPSSSDCTPTPKKRIVPLKVRQEVRQVYKTLLDDKENFSGWCFDLGATIKSNENEKIMRTILKEVKGLNPTFDGVDIREAAYRFYKSKCEEEALRRSGKTESKKISRRRHERIARKRKEREAAIRKNGRLNEEQKAKWLSVMDNAYMSSEESGDEDSIIVHRLEWRSEYVNQMFQRIDTYSSSKKSPQARRQMKKRVSGTNSIRSKPWNGVAWAITR